MLVLRAQPLALDARRLALPLALGGLSLVLRLPGLNSTLTFDEIGQVVAARRSLPELFAAVREHAAAAPLDYLGTRIAITLSPDLTLGPRLWPLAFGILAIALMYATVWAMGGRASAAYASAAGMAVAPFLVAYSDIARFYMLAVVVALLSLWALARLDGHWTAARWAAWAATGVLAFHTQYPLMGLIGAEAAWLLICRPARRRATIATLAAVGLACLPWALYALPVQLGRHYPYASSSFGAYVGEMVATLSGGAFAAAMASIVGVLALAGLWARRTSLYVLVAAVALAALPVEWFAETRSGFYADPRHVIVLVPLVLLLAGEGFAYMLERRPRFMAVVVGALGLCLVSGFGLVFSPPGPDWRAASAWVEAHAGPASRIGSTVQATWAFGVGYYAPRLAISEIPPYGSTAGYDIAVDYGWPYLPGGPFTGQAQLALPPCWQAVDFGGALRVLYAPETPCA